MKKIITILFFFSMLFCMDGFGQKPGDKRVMADNKTRAGKRELRREERVKRHEAHNLKKQERKAAKSANKKLHQKTLGTRVKKHKKKENPEPIRKQ